MTCTNCAKELSDTAKFCRGCGTPVKAQRQPMPVVGADKSASPEEQAELEVQAELEETVLMADGPMETAAAGNFAVGAGRTSEPPVPQSPVPVPVSPGPKIALPAGPPPPLHNAIRPPAGLPPKLRPLGMPPRLGVAQRSPSTPARTIPGESGRQRPTPFQGKFILALVAGLGLVGLAAFGFLHSSATTDADDHGVFFLTEQPDKNSYKIRVVTETGSEIYSELITDSTVKTNDQLFIGAQTDESWGISMVNPKSGAVMLIDRFGRKTIDPPGLPFQDFTEGFAPARPVKGSTLCGYMDREHKMKIPAAYQSCGAFSGGMAAVGLNNKFGYVDKNGNLSIPIQYSHACAFSEGLAKVNLDGHWQVIDGRGKLVFSASSDDCRIFAEGLMESSVGGLSGYVNRTGQFAIPASYSGWSNFADGRAFVKLNNRDFVLIDKNAKQIPLPGVFDFQIFEQGLARASKSVNYQAKWGLIDTQGRFVVEPKYERIGPLVSGLRKASVDKSLTPDFLDVHGLPVKPPTANCYEYNHGVFSCLTSASAAEAARNSHSIQPRENLPVDVDYFTRTGTRIGGVLGNK